MQKYMLINMFQLIDYMALVMAIGAYQTEQKLTKSKKQVLIEETMFLRDNAIIPMLETDNMDFEGKFNNAINYYSYYTIKMNEIFGFTSVKRIRNRKASAESYLRGLSMISKQFSNIDNKDIQSAILGATSKIEDYFLLVGDKKIDTEKAKYNPIIGASFIIWVSIMGLREILSNESYKNKTDLLIQKCQTGTKIMEDYVMMIAQDHGRVFSAELEDTLKNIDSGKTKTMRFKNVNDYLKHLDAISVE
jgi:hypothetical protein